MTQPTAEQLRLARKCAVGASKASGSNLSARLEAAYLRGDFDGSFEVQSALLAIQATEARMALGETKAAPEQEPRSE